MTADPQSPSDEALARQSQAGSLGAFEDLVYRYEGRVFRFVRSFSRRDIDAQEITQDTFVRAFQAIAQFDARQSFAPWLFTIARRKCIDHYRSAPPPTASPVPEPADFDDPAELLARDEDRRDLWRLARLRLPELQFQALWLRYVEDLSVAAIARIMLRTQIHVKVLLFRARRALGRELETSAVALDPAPLRPKPAPLKPARLSPA